MASYVTVRYGSTRTDQRYVTLREGGKQTSVCRWYNSETRRLAAIIFRLLYELVRYTVTPLLGQ